MMVFCQFLSDRNLIVSFCFTVCFLITSGHANGVYNVSNWKYHFPSGSGMGIYAALALPVPDSGNIDLFYAVFFEAYYSLPYNETYFEYPPLVGERSFGRKSLYNSIESKLLSKGYPGKECLLKAICNVGSYTTLHANGIVGDIVHLLFTPSSTKHYDDNQFADYLEAEETGMKWLKCDKYKCDLNLFDMLSFVK